MAESETAAASHKRYIHGFNSDDHTGKGAQSDVDDRRGNDASFVAVERDTDSALFRCGKCCYSCASSAELKAHKSTHTAEKRYICHECYYRTTTAYKLRQHIARHTGERCDRCSAAFLSKNELATHKLSHTGEKPFMCEVCGFSTSTKKCAKQTYAASHEVQSV